MEWKPIETAPKDGTRLLLMRENRRHSHLPPILWIKVGEWTAWHSDGYVEAWREDVIASGGDTKRIRLVPTHWMPLPPPPRSEGE